MTKINRSTSQKVYREVFRVVFLLLVGLSLIAFTPDLAIYAAIPALSPWGLFLGGMLIAGAVSHVMRRVLFPHLDLQLIAILAVRDRNMQAAIVFASICAILGLLLFLNASMLRI